MGKLIDLTGKRFGRWTVLERAESDGNRSSRWSCRCACGTERVVLGASLRSGISRSCGCLQKEKVSKAKTIDMTGQVFGKLTVIKRTGSTRGGAAAWLCKCDCGNEAIISGGNLRSGNTKSCGCLKTLPRGVAAFNKVLHSLKGGAEKRGHAWYLTDEQVRHLTKRPCYYCGIEPSQISGNGHTNGVYVYNGIDRLDNTKGYTIDNVVPCCGTCNYAKHTMTLEKFTSWAKRLCEHFVMGV